jgi:hypothetical protein
MFRVHVGDDADQAFRAIDQLRPLRRLPWIREEPPAA